MHGPLHLRAMNNTSIEKPKISIFDFNDFRSYLLSAGMPDGLYGHTANNLKSWANRLGYKSPSSLTMVLKGTRLPSYDMIRSFVKDLNLNNRERKYFELLVELEKVQAKGKDTSHVLEQINQVTQNSGIFQLEMKTFSTISEWYYLAIKQLISSPDFINDPEWIYKKLRKKVTPSQIKTALENLEELDIISNVDGKLKVLKPGLITTNDVPSSAIKRHHYGMIQRALESIDEQKVENRQINSLTMKVEKNKLPEAKKFIFDFLKEFNERYSSNNSNDLYQLNVQLFEHTKDVYFN